jgi:hypothetical protein
MLRKKPHDKVESADALLARTRAALYQELTDARKAVVDAQARVKQIEGRLKMLDKTAPEGTVMAGRGERTGIERDVIAFLVRNGATPLKNLHEVFAEHPKDSIRQALIRARRKGLVKGGDGSGVYEPTRAGSRAIRLRD